MKKTTSIIQIFLAFILLTISGIFFIFIKDLLQGCLFGFLSLFNLISYYGDR